MTSNPGQISRLEPGTYVYYHNEQIFVIGVGINVPHIVACGPPLASRCHLTEQRGFLMGDDTCTRRQLCVRRPRDQSQTACAIRTAQGSTDSPGTIGEDLWLQSVRAAERLPPEAVGLS